MSALRIIGFISAAILLFFGVLFIWGAFSPQGSPGWIVIGLITVAIAFGLIFLSTRKKEKAADKNQVTLKIDLSGDINLESLKCKSCGGSLSPENIQMLAGAPVVSCPFCKSTYQLTEEPKW